MAIPKGLGTVDDLIRRFKKAAEEWELWRSLHQEAFDFANPQRETFRLRSPGQRKNRHIFDDTAVLGLEQYTSVIQGSVVPSWQQWAELTAGSNVPEEDEQGVNEALEEVTDTFFASLNHTNFSTEISPAFSDYGIGTGAVEIEEGDFAAQEEFRFVNVPLSECYPEKPASGRIKSSWRKQEVEAGKIKQIWPDADLPTEVINAEKKDPFKKIPFLNGMLYNFDDRRYYHIVIHEASKTVIFQQDFATSRRIIFRNHVVPGETFGRGPVIQVLPDIRTANKVKQFILENAALQMAGVYTGVDDGIFNPHTVRIAPGSIIPVGSNASANPSLTALPRSGDLGLGGLVLEDLQNNIRKALFSDPFGELDDPVRTATEQLLRKQEMLIVRGASLGRLKTELVEPLIAAVIDILKGLGKVPDITVDGKDVTIKHTSPLAKAEDTEDFQNFSLWMQTLKAMFPDEFIAGTVAVEDIPTYTQDKLGIPATLVRNKTDRAKFGETIQEAAQQNILGQGGGPVEPGA